MSGFNLPGQDISQIFKAAAKGAVVDGAEDVSIDSKVMNTKKSTPLAKTSTAEPSLEKKGTNAKDVKEDVKEVATGYECGLNIANYNDIKIGDLIEAYEEVEVKKTL